MRKEMGNTNTSGIQEAEEAAAVSLNDPPSANDHNVEKLTSISRDEQEAADREQTSQFSEVQLEAEEDSAPKSSDIQRVDSNKEVERDEEPKYEENNQSNIQSFTHTGEVENIDPNLDSMSDPFTRINAPVQLPDSNCNSPSRNRENFAEADDDMNHCTKTEIENTDVENADKETNEEGNLEVNLGKTDLSSNVEEDVTKVNTLDCSDEDSEPKEECMILPQEINGNSSFPVDQTSTVQNLGECKDCLTNETEDEEQTSKKFEAADNGDVQNSADTIKQIFVTNEVRGIPRPEKEQPQTVNGTPGTISEQEMLTDMSDEQCANGIISPLPVIRSKMMETTRRYSVDYSSEQPSGNQIETRRFPSFDFGIPFDARSSESDQTPLLRPEKLPTRRLSIDFQSTVLQAAYAQDSLDYDTMGVEEKTIRVENDAPFLITLKTEENGNLTEKTAEILLAADMKEGNIMLKNIPPANDHLALASPKSGNGKRKPLPSFFSTCICCTATTN